MKICFLTKDVFRLGGIERVTSIIANNLCEENEVYIWCCEKSDSNEDRQLYSLDSRINVRIYNIRSNRPSKSIIRFINTRTNFFNKKRYNSLLFNVYFNEMEQKKFINEIEQEKFDVVIGTSYDYNILLGKISNKISSKTIAWQHSAYGTMLENKKQFLWNQSSILKEYMSYLDEIIVLTNEDKSKYYSNLNLKSEVIPNPVTFKIDKKSDLKSKNILYVGRLDSDKQPKLIMEVFFKVWNKYKDWNLIFVGDGEEMNILKNEARELGIQDNVKFIGKVNNVTDYYLKSSIFLNTSKWENFSLSLIEAMECGVPIIAFDNQGPREIINKNGENGVLVPNGDLEKLQYESIKLIESEEERKKISKNEIERVKDFYIENVIKKWNKILKERVNEQ